ncbi:MAG: restriction endonuclease subunit S [Lacticaseibacillus paracasei]
MSKIRDHQSTQPAIRFKGFTDAWEKRKLGKWFAERTERSGEGEMLSVTISSGVVRANSLDRKDNSSTDKSNYKVVHIGDIAYNSMRMWQAASGVSNYDGIVSPAYTVLVPAAEVSSVFFGYQFKQTKMKQIFQRNSQGLTSDTWNLKYPLLAKIKTSAPQKTEQVKIGTFFATLDHLIAVNQRKGDVLQNLKKGLLQRLFASETSPIPDIRFKGFTDAWEKRKLAEVAEINPKSEIPETFRYIDLESVKGSAIINSRSETRQTAPSRAQRTARIGDVFYQTVRPYQRNNVIFLLCTTEPYVFSSGYAQLRSLVNPFFILYLVQTDNFVNRVLNRATGTSYPAINPTHLSNIPVWIPQSFSEQKRVGQLLRRLDNLITATQRKGEVLKNLKKALLQKMFV